MKPHEMREMTEEELQNHHDTLIEEMANLRIKLAAKQVDNPLSIRVLRKDIARVNTILKEKALGAHPGQTLAQKKQEEGA
jgi:large subunit ribosomal protein L29